jgi:hypothetical protein
MSAGRRELDGQGHPIQHLANRHHVLGRPLRQRKIRTRRPGAFDEQPDRGRPLGPLDRGDAVGWRQRQGRDGKCVLPRHAKHGPARRQAGKPRARFEQLGDERRGLQQMLEVIEHEERALRAYSGGDPLRQGPVAGLADVELLGDGIGDVRGVTDLGQPHEPDAIGETLPDVLGDLQRQPGFAHASRAGEGDEADRGLAEEAADGGELTGSPDQGRQGYGEHRVCMSNPRPRDECQRLGRGLMRRQGNHHAVRRAATRR